MRTVAMAVARRPMFLGVPWFVALTPLIDAGSDLLLGSDIGR
jgi:hypothetical protein